MLPRPVVKSRPHRLGHRIMTKCVWLRKLVQDIESLTLKHLELDKSPTSVIIQKHLEASKKLIPPCLRICDTFFTQMIFLGTHGETEGSIPPHLDKDDHITALFSMGSECMIGNQGTTVYIEKNEPDDRLTIIKRISFRHGNLQIGTYDKVIHGSLGWDSGERFVMNLSLQKKILDHFYTNGNGLYNQYINHGYPSGKFQIVGYD